MLLKHKAILICSIFTFGISATVGSRAARADFFNDINNNINNIRGTQKNANDAAGNVTNILGIGQPNNSSNNTNTNVTPVSITTTSNDKVVDANTQLSEGYFAWYSGLTPADRDIVKELTKKYAEDKPMTFAEFSKTKFYKGKNDATKSQASAVFFKFKETIDAVGSQKTKFLAFAFCVNGGGKDCK